VRARFDLQEVEAALRGAQAALFAQAGRDAMDEHVVENMLAAYGCLDELLERGVDPLAPGQVSQLLEINRLVLCGADPARRARYAEHLAAGEERFYNEPDAGIGDLVEAMRVDAGESVWERAAGAYVHMSLRPQLFIEGNHRTGALVMSSVLAGAGEPPFVLTAQNAGAYFEASARLRDIPRNSLTATLRVPGHRKELAAFLRAECRASYLRHG